MPNTGVAARRSRLIPTFAVVAVLSVVVALAARHPWFGTEQPGPEASTCESTPEPIAVPTPTFDLPGRSHALTVVIEFDHCPRLAKVEIVITTYYLQTDGLPREIQTIHVSQQFPGAWRVVIPAQGWVEVIAHQSDAALLSCKISARETVVDGPRAIHGPGSVECSSRGKLIPGFND